MVVLGALAAFGPLSTDLYLPALPEMADDLQTSASSTQLTVTACVVGLALGQLVLGPLADRFGRRRPLLVALLVYTVASVLCAFAPSVWPLIALRAVQGIAGAGGIVIGLAIARDLRSGPELARLLATLTIIMGAAPVLSPLVGAGLLQLGDWRLTFHVLAAIVGVILAGALLWLPETLPPERRVDHGVAGTLRVAGRLIRDRTFVGYALAGGFTTGALFSYLAGGPFVIQDVYGVSQGGYAAMFACNATGIVLMGRLSGRLVVRVGPRRLLLTGLSVALTGGLLLLLAVLAELPLGFVLVALFLTISSLGLVLPNSRALALSEQGDVAGSAAALLGANGFFIGGLLAPLMGVAGRGTAVPMAISLCVCTIAALAAWYTLARHHRPAVAPVPAPART